MGSNNRPAMIDRECRLSGQANPRTSRPLHDMPIRWDEAQLSARLHHLPTALVHQAVVEETQQDKAGDVGLAPFRPGDEVMGLRPVRRAIAPRPAATAVPRPQGAARRSGYD